MKISQPPVEIGQLTEAITTNVKGIVHGDCPQDLNQWLSNNLLPSLAWLATDHLSSCIAMTKTCAAGIVTSLKQLLNYIQQTSEYLQGDGAVIADNDKSPTSGGFILRKIRQMNVLVFLVTRQVLALMSNSMLQFRSQANEMPPQEDRLTQGRGMQPIELASLNDIDLDISSSLVWHDDMEYTLCITLTSKVDINIDNCVSTLTNINGTAGDTVVDVTYYEVLEQTDNTYKILFNTLYPRQYRKILVRGKAVRCATFTVTIQDTGQRWADTEKMEKMQHKLLTTITQKTDVAYRDLQILHCTALPQDDTDYVLVVIRLFSPHARAAVRTLRKQHRCMDFAMLYVVDIREGIPPDCLPADGQPELVINVSSTIIIENTALSDQTESPNRCDSQRSITFSPMNKVERNWTADIFISDSLPVIDSLVVQEELFRQDVATLLTRRFGLSHVGTAEEPPIPTNDVCGQTVNDVYSLLEAKYRNITNSNFVKELLFQLSLHGEKEDELREMGNTIAQQNNTGGRQELFSLATKPPPYQQMVNLFMNIYILQHHLALTLQEHQTQLEEERNCLISDHMSGYQVVVADEAASRHLLGQEFLETPKEGTVVAEVVVDDTPPAVEPLVLGDTLVEKEEPPPIYRWEEEKAFLLADHLEGHHSVVAEETLHRSQINQAFMEFPKVIPVADAPPQTWDPPPQEEETLSAPDCTSPDPMPSSPLVPLPPTSPRTQLMTPPTSIPTAATAAQAPQPRKKVAHGTTSRHRSTFPSIATVGSLMDVPHHRPRKQRKGSATTDSSILSSGSGSRGRPSPRPSPIPDVSSPSTITPRGHYGHLNHTTPTTRRLAGTHPNGNPLTPPRTGPGSTAKGRTPTPLGGDHRKKSIPTKSPGTIRRTPAHRGSPHATGRISTGSLPNDFAAHYVAPPRTASPRTPRDKRDSLSRTRTQTPQRGAPPRRDTTPVQDEAAASRKEKMKLRQELTRQRIKNLEQEQKKRAEAAMRQRFSHTPRICTPAAPPPPTVKRTTARQRSKSEPTAPRGKELNTSGSEDEADVQSLLKTAFNWVPAQPPPPPPNNVVLLKDPAYHPDGRQHSIAGGWETLPHARLAANGLAGPLGDSPGSRRRDR